MKTTHGQNLLVILTLSLSAIGGGKAAEGASVAIVKGDFYTANLKNALVAAGHTVTEIGTYTAATLAPFNAVIQYGNDFLDQAALSTYATGGGRVIETPWFWNNNSPIATLDIFSHGGSSDFSLTYPGVTVLKPADPLLNGVTFPPSGGFNIGRTTGNTFTAGVTQVANWADGATGFIGYKPLGSGLVIGINMHVVTSDTAFQAIDQPWAGRLFANAVGGVPEPCAAWLLVAGAAMLGCARRRG